MKANTCIHFALPFRGRKDYLFEVVDSLIAQNDANWLLSVIENGRDDDSIQQWLEAFNDPRIAYFFNETDIGLASNFNAVMKKVHGKWAVVLGADDVLDVSYVQRMRQVIKEFPEASFIHPGVRIIDEYGNTKKPILDKVKTFISIKPKKIRHIESNRLCASLMLGNWLYFPSICWNMDFYRKFEFDENLPQTLDFDLALKVILESKGAYFFPDTIYSYRRHRQSISSQGALQGYRFIEERVLYRKYSEIFKSHKMYLAFLLASLRLTHRIHALIGLRNIAQSIGYKKALTIVFN
jgi:glycosyltransferase involved in cell wall biosynthesis